MIPETCRIDLTAFESQTAVKVAETTFQLRLKPQIRVWGHSLVGHE